MRISSLVRRKSFGRNRTESSAFWFCDFALLGSNVFARACDRIRLRRTATLRKTVSLCFLFGTLSFSSSCSSIEKAQSFNPDQEGAAASPDFVRVEDLDELRRENAALRKSLAHAEERLRFYEGRSTVESHQPGTARLPVVKLKPPKVRSVNTVLLSEAGQGSDPRAKETPPNVPAPTDEVVMNHRSTEGGSYRLVGSQRRDLPSKEKGTKAANKGKKLRPAKTFDEGTASVTANVQSEDPSDLYRRSMAAYRAGDYGRAANGFRRVALASPNHEFADNALYWYGEIHYDRGDFETAIDSFFKVVEKYSDGNKVPDALLKVGLCYEQLGDRERGRDVLRQVIDAFPNSRVAGVARKRLLEMKDERKIKKGS